MFVIDVVTVTATPTLLFDVDTRRQTVIVRNTDETDSVKLGPSDVTYATGFSLKAGESMSFLSDQFVRESKSSLYAIADTSVTVSVEVLSYNPPFQG
jgi:hypothetical protein